MVIHEEVFMNKAAITAQINTMKSGRKMMLDALNNLKQESTATRKFDQPESSKYLDNASKHVA